MVASLYIFVRGYRFEDRPAFVGLEAKIFSPPTSSLVPPSSLFPFDRTGRLGTDIIDDPVDTLHFIDNPVGEVF